MGGLDPRSFHRIHNSRSSALPFLHPRKLTLPCTPSLESCFSPSFNIHPIFDLVTHALDVSPTILPSSVCSPLAFLPGISHIVSSSISCPVSTSGLRSRAFYCSQSRSLRPAPPPRWNSPLAKHTIIDGVGRALFPFLMFVPCSLPPSSQLVRQSVRNVFPYLAFFSFFLLPEFVYFSFLCFFPLDFFPALFLVRCWDSQSGFPLSSS